MTLLKILGTGGTNMKLEIKCPKCESTKTTTDRIEGAKAFFGTCECGSKQEVKWIEAPSKGNK
jgi:phage FluMu protein Com